MKIFLFIIFLLLIGVGDTYCQTPEEKLDAVDLNHLKRVERNIDDWKTEASKIDKNALSYQDLTFFVTTESVFEVVSGYVYDIKENAAGYNLAVSQNLSKLCRKRTYIMYVNTLPFVKNIETHFRSNTLVMRDGAKNRHLRTSLNNAAKVLMQFNSALGLMIKEAEAIASAATASGSGG